MKTYTLTCASGHEPMTWTVQANSPMEAAGMFAEMQPLKDHVGSAHPEMLSKSHDEMMADLVSMITPTE